MSAPATPKGSPMLSPDETDLRLQCLSLAVSVEHGSETVKLARDFHAFVTGTSDKTPRERICAALDAANVS